jgi:hypothetical protein
VWYHLIGCGGIVDGLTSLLAYACVTVRKVVLECGAILFTAKPLRAALARVVLAHYSVLKDKTERTVLYGIVIKSTLSNITRV